MCGDKIYLDAQSRRTTNVTDLYGDVNDYAISVKAMVKGGLFQEKITLYESIVNRIRASVYLTRFALWLRIVFFSFENIGTSSIFFFSFKIGPTVPLLQPTFWILLTFSNQVTKPLLYMRRREILMYSLSDVLNVSVGL